MEEHHPGDCADPNTTLSTRVAARLEKFGLTTPALVQSYVAQFPEGGAFIGRANLPEVQRWLAALNDDAAPTP